MIRPGCRSRRQARRKPVGVSASQRHTLYTHMLLAIAIASTRPVTPSHRVVVPSTMALGEMPLQELVSAASPQLLGGIGLAAGLAATLPRRRLFFSSLDEAAAVSYLRSFPTQAFQLWSTTEWQRLGVDEKLEFSTRTIDGGVRIVYYLPPPDARRLGLAGVVEDGGFELTASQNSIVGRADPGRISRARAEEVIWQRLVLQVTKGIAMERAGGKPTLGAVRGIYPCSMEKVRAQVERTTATFAHLPLALSCGMHLSFFLQPTPHAALHRHLSW